MSAHAKIIVPGYVPDTYSFSGLALTELPCIVQHYLANVACITPPTATPPNTDIFALCRSQLAASTHRLLQGIDIALVEKRREVREFSRKTKWTVEELRDAQETDEECLQHVVGVLLPERSRVLDEFVANLDGLVWLELEATYAEDGGCDPVPEQQRYRDGILAPFLDFIHRALVALDDAVVERDEAARTPVDDIPRVRWSRRSSISPADLDKSIELLHEQISKLIIQKIELLRPDANANVQRNSMSDVRNTLGRQAAQPWKRGNGTAAGHRKEANQKASPESERWRFGRKVDVML